MLEHDVLVIGAGLAGMRAAIAAQANGANTDDKGDYRPGTR